MNKYYILITGLLILTVGCTQKKSALDAAPAPEVGVVTITAKSLPVIAELPGRLNAVRTAQVRARATGILLKQVYKEGADIKEGDLLFQIDPAPLKASYDSAKANLDRAQANFQSAQDKAQRFKKLVVFNAVSQQDNEDARTVALQAKADLDFTKAALETAHLNLEYTAVKAPISGRIGPSLVTEGALVSQTEATPMALIQQLDPIYFDFTESSTDVLRLKRAFDQGQLKSITDSQVKINLILEDGTTYEEKGTLLFSDATVDPSSGMVSLRAVFPNPHDILLPGMFARCRIEQAVKSAAIEAPQRGIVIGVNGAATALVIKSDNTVELRVVKIGFAIGDQWVITAGLNAGERIIVEGVQKVKPGMVVKTVPFQADQVLDTKVSEHG